ncbi:MAG: DUF1549 domain-containing protein [Planctomycetales bacterium]|nr:DUF1549 domain-containing protein [Planctomycetales bacterium]
MTISRTLLLAAAVLATTGRVTAQESSSQSRIPQVEQINRLVQQGWADYELTPSTPATESEWCRRVFLDVLGRVPSVNELKEFLNSKSVNKRDDLVNMLLEDEKYTEEYARNWTTIWTNILIGRSGGTERNTLTSREGMQKYLRDTFARNKPYNKMVFELVTATGSSSPGSDNFNGAVNFLVMKVNEEKATLATSETSKIFMGLQVQCTQCHNHPFNEWKQQKFWEMNAIFRQTRALRTFVPGTRDVASAELVNEDFAGEGLNPEEAEVFYELRNGEVRSAMPRFVDGTDIEPSGYIEDVVRRNELGKLMLQSEYIDRMLVNRYWAHFLGYGFTKPIDDMGPHNPPSHPELLDYLSTEIRKNSYNLKDLIRWITLSEAYSLSSRVTAGNKSDDPLLGELPKFTHFYLRQMQAEELYESLIVATQAQKTRGSYEEQEKSKTQWLQQFVQAFGTDEGQEATTFNGTIPQALMMMNGDLIKRATGTDKGSFLGQIADSPLKPAQKIDYLFMAGLGRSATNAEVTVANKLLLARKGDQAAALQDMWWAVLNSNEFIMNH